MGVRRTVVAFGAAIAGVTAVQRVYITDGVFTGGRLLNVR